jgi:xanthine/uracil permease
MQLKYNIDDVPPLPEFLLFGLQWLAIEIPVVVLIGQIIGDIHFADPALKLGYLQKLSFATGIVWLVQILWGHRLPLITGPSSVLLVGVIASAGFAAGIVYTSIMIGGALLFLIAAAGLFGYLQALFTRRVVAVVLLLIAFTLMPTVLRLLTSTGAPPQFAGLLFGITLVLCAFAAQRRVSAIWGSVMILWIMAVGTGLWHLLFPGAVEPAGVVRSALSIGFLRGFTVDFSVSPGVLIGFLVCFIGLSINDLGSIESIGGLLNPPNMVRRINRGIALTGLGNVFCGFCGVVGCVSFSLSPGVILSTRCGSRFAMVPGAALLILLSFSPSLLSFVGRVPSVVMGAALLYVLAFQVAAGLMKLTEGSDGLGLDVAVVAGLPVLIGTAVASLPGPVLHAFPITLQPIVGNGFVMGIAAALILEHVVYKKREKSKN